MMTYTLTDAEQTLVKNITDKRQEYNDKSGAVATPYGKRSLAQINLDAYGAEMAFARLFDTEFNMDTDRHVHYDTYIGGSTVDIKNSDRMKDGWLGVKDLPYKEKPYWYALVLGSFPGPYKFAGFMSASSVINHNHYRTKIGYYELPHPMYIANQYELIQEVM